LGSALARKGDGAGAVTEDREAVRLDPNNAAAPQLGSALARQGSWDDAIAQDREAIRLNRDSTVAHSSLGVALMQTGDWSSAMAELVEAVRLGPKNGDALFNLGLAMIHQKEGDDALTEERAVVNLRPEEAVAHSKLGLAYRGRGDYAKAGAEEREAIGLKPDLAEAHFILGVVLEWQGDLAGALAECRKATELDPSDPIYRKTAERLYQDVHRHQQVAFQVVRAAALLVDWRLCSEKRLGRDEAPFRGIESNQLELKYLVFILRERTDRRKRPSALGNRPQSDEKFRFAPRFLKVSGVANTNMPSEIHEVPSSLRGRRLVIVRRAS